MNPDWDGYLAEHSIEKLSEAFEKLVQHSLKQKYKSGVEGPIDGSVSRDTMLLSSH
jgi:hypothetical protein